MRAACALHARCMRAACALHARCMRAACAGHSFRALATRCAFVGCFNKCALCALRMRTVYAQRASNTLCMRCQLTSFSQIRTKVGRTTTHWSYFSFFYARTVRRVCVTGNNSRHRDANHAFTSVTHRRIRSIANAASLRGKSICARIM